MNPDINVSVSLPAPIQITVGTPPAVALSATGIGGRKGDKGDTGAQGPQGIPGEPGAQGDPGLPGADSTIPGPKGDTGATGPQGIQGIQGVQGLKGDTGATGETGPQGIQGVKGDTGATGANGTNGVDGDTWYNGNGAPDGALGKVGDYYLDNATGSVHEKTGSATWTITANIKGPAGAGTGDMLASVYDPAGGSRQVAFADELGGGGVTDHGALTGLADDDHIQYHTDIRGDARYYQKSEVDTALTNKVDAGTSASNNQLVAFSDTTGTKIKAAGFSTGSIVTPSSTHTLTNKTISGASNTISDVAQSSVTNLTTDLAGKAAATHTHAVADMTATGTRSSATYLRGDNTWNTPTNTTYTEITDAEITTGTASTLRTISGRRAQTIVNKAVAAAPVQSVAGKSGAVTLAKADVGLSNVDDTSDATKNVDMVDGFHASATPTANTIPVLDVNGKMPTTALESTIATDANGWADYGLFYLKRYSHVNSTSISANASIYIDTATSAGSGPVAEAGAFPVARTLVTVSTNTGTTAQLGLIVTMDSTYSKGFFTFNAGSAATTWGTRLITMMILKA